MQSYTTPKCWQYLCIYFGLSLTVGATNAPLMADIGADDTCSGAVATGVGVGAPYSEVMNITPVGDHNWRSFTNPGPDAWAVRIETISDEPGTFSDDTDLTLWSDCPENGGTLVALNDDKPGDTTSLIQTNCVLGPGTWYVEVGGAFNLSRLRITLPLKSKMTDTCTPTVNLENSDVSDPFGTSSFGCGSLDGPKY